jgi:hypothetical protein
MTFWCRSGSPDPYPWLMDLDPTPFFIDFKNAKKIFVFIFFLITCPQAHHLPSKKFNFLPKILCWNFICRHYFNTCMRKGKDPDLYPWLIDRDPDAGGPKTCGSGSGSRSPTLLNSLIFAMINWLWKQVVVASNTHRSSSTKLFKP